jgi:hypothetical protein
MIVRWAIRETTPDADDGDVVEERVQEIDCGVVLDMGVMPAADHPEHPVEGGVVSDHVVAQPRQVTVVTSVSDVLDGAPRRTADVVETLARLAEEGTVVDVEDIPLTPLRDYQIASAPAQLSQATGPRAAEIQVTLVRRRVVRLRTAEVPAPRVERARPRQESGEQSGTTEEPTTRERASALTRLSRGILGGDS